MAIVRLSWVETSGKKFGQIYPEQSNTVHSIICKLDWHHLLATNMSNLHHFRTHFEDVVTLNKHIFFSSMHFKPVKKILRLQQKGFKIEATKSPPCITWKTTPDHPCVRFHLHERCEKGFNIKPFGPEDSFIVPSCLKVGMKFAHWITSGRFENC